MVIKKSVVCIGNPDKTRHLVVHHIVQDLKKKNNGLPDKVVVDTGSHESLVGQEYQV